MTREWHRDGATIYTLKENTGRRRAGSPEFVNDNWMQVQGPDAEAVAAEVKAALDLHAPLVSALKAMVEAYSEQGVVPSGQPSMVYEAMKVLARANFV